MPFGVSIYNVNSYHILEVELKILMFECSEWRLYPHVCRFRTEKSKMVKNLYV